MQQVNTKPSGIVQHLEGLRKAMTVNQVAEILSVSPKTIYRMAEESSLPYLRVRGSLRFDPHDVAAWLRAQKPPVLGSRSRPIQR